MVNVRGSHTAALHTLAPSHLRIPNLATHDCVVHETYSTPHGWEFVIDEALQTIQAPARLTGNLGDAAVAAAVAGAGIVRVLSYVADDFLQSGSFTGSARAL